APMCGEEGITCTTGMPRFSELAINGSPATNPQPGSGTGLENKSAWALEVALDVETAHAIAPGANILLVHSNNAETLGVQGFPQMMKAEDYVVTNHPRTNYMKPGIGAKCGSNTYNPGGVNAEVAWTFSGGGFSHMFAKQSWQNTLPAGSTAIGAMRGVPDVAFQASAGTGALVYLS